MATAPASRLFALGASCIALALAACGEPDAGSDGAAETSPESPQEQAQQEERNVTVTGATQVVAGGAAAVTAIPQKVNSYYGLLLAAPNEGGLALYNVDGELVSETDGPRYGAVAAAPAFQLRGSRLPLIAALDVQNDELDFYGVGGAESQIIEVPVNTVEPEVQARGLCEGEPTPSQLDIFLLGAEGGGERWRLRDTGADTLSAERVGRIETPFPARYCAFNPGDDTLFVASPAGQLARIGSDGAAQQQRELVVSGLSFGIVAGSPRLVATTDSEVLLLDPETLETVENLEFGPGLSIPGLKGPGAIFFSGDEYGGAYPDGMLIVADSSDQTLKLIDRGYLERELVAPDNPFAPTPPPSES